MIRIRRAVEEDLDALLRLERSFPTDRLDRDRYRALLDRPGATVLVAETEGRVRAGVVLLWRRNASAGRLYSIAVDPECRGRGLGARLLRASEETAIRRGLSVMSLEVREDNSGARAFYRKHGYRDHARLRRYYEDGAGGVRMRKELAPAILPPVELEVPYYPQSQDFTCGPACLMMAMKREDPALELTPTLELTLWKEATLIYMTSGLGGCGPMGLAVAARRRGFEVEVARAGRGVPFLKSVRARSKREVITLMYQALSREAAALGVRTEHFKFGHRALVQAMHRGVVPIVLMSTYRLHGIRAPHWVVVTGYRDGKVSFHDPYEGFYVHDVRWARHVTVEAGEFERMSAYGKGADRSAVLVGRRSRPHPDFKSAARKGP